MPSYSSARSTAGYCLDADGEAVGRFQRQMDDRRLVQERQQFSRAGNHPGAISTGVTGASSRMTLFCCRVTVVRAGRKESLLPVVADSS